MMRFSKAHFEAKTINITPSLSAWMPKSSDHGWQNIDYKGLKSVDLLPSLAWISASMPK